MKKTAFLLASFAALPAWAQWAAMDTAQAVSASELVVVGTLEGLEPWSAGEIEGVKAGIAVKEVLYGKAPPSPLPFGWSNPRGLACPRVEHGDKAGSPRIWLLSKGRDGLWHADHPQRVLEPKSLAEVGKAIQDRIAPLVRALEASDVLSGWAHIEGTPADTKACLDLAQAGPAAIPAARGLMKHGNAVQRAWGCRLAGLLKEKALIPDVEALLKDGAPLKALKGCVPEGTTVAEQARKALDTPEARTGALCPACAGKGIAHYIVSCRSCGKTDKVGKCCAGPHAQADLCSVCAKAKGVCLGCGKPSAP